MLSKAAWAWPTNSASRSSSFLAFARSKQESSRANLNATRLRDTSNHWSSGCGAPLVRIPGTIDGNEFDARFDDAVDAIYRSGQQRPVAYSHGAAIASGP